MPTPPTLISYTETSWSSSASTKSTASISWQSGDVIVVISISEGSNVNDAPALPTATGLIFTSQENVTSNSGTRCTIRVSTATPGSSGSGAVTVTDSTGFIYGFGVWVWRGSAGVGNHTSTATPSSTQTVSLTATAADSAIMWGSGDFSAAAVGTITPTPTDTRQRVAVGTAYTIYVADLTDQSSAGAVSYGTSGAGTGPFSIVALEIKAAASAFVAEDDSFMVPRPANIEPTVSVW